MDRPFTDIENQHRHVASATVGRKLEIERVTKTNVERSAEKQVIKKSWLNVVT